MLLIDGPNFAWRAFHAGGNLQSRNRPTGLLHVALSMLAALPDIVPKQSILFLWDFGPSWRKDVLKVYKVRPKSDKDDDRVAAYPQMDLFREALTALGIRQAQIYRLEADDLAGIFTERLANAGKEATLLSSDKDWLQLLRAGVVQIRGWKGKRPEIWNDNRVLKEFGVIPEKIPEYLALVGDSSDTIPKALRRGAGPAQAIKVLHGQATLNAQELAQYELNLKVTRILREYDPVKLKQAVTDPPRTKAGLQAFRDILSEYEMFSLLAESEQLWQVGAWR